MAMETYYTPFGYVSQRYHEVRSRRDGTPYRTRCNVEVPLIQVFPPADRTHLCLNCLRAAEREEPCAAP